MKYDKANRLIEYNGEEVKYDADGNMTYGPVDGKMTKLSYDSRNRLIKAGEITYEYDSENNKIAANLPEYREEYVWAQIGSFAQRIMLKRYEASGDNSSENKEYSTIEHEKATYYYGVGLEYEKLKSQYAADEIYNAERIGSALKEDPAHRADSYLSKEQLANGRTYSFTGGDNKSYMLLQTKEQLDGADGIFEYITNDVGQVTHQRFIKEGIYTGFPNQVVPKGGF